LKTNSDDEPYTTAFLGLPLLAGTATSLGGNFSLIILIIILLCLTAIVAGAEVAFFSLSAKDLNYLKTKDKGTNKTIISLLENPQKLLATLLIANSFMSIGIIVATNILVSNLIDFTTILGTEYKTMADILNVIIQVVLVTFFLVLFGEVLPKVYATQNNMRMSLLCAPFINFLNKILSPFSNVLARSSALIEKNINNKRSSISNVDVENALELTMHSATKEEVNMFRGILKFHDITVKQIMRPRLDISGVSHASTYLELQKIVLDCGYSRIPIFENTLDTIKGVLHTKDLLAFENTTANNWHTLIKPALFVHENKLIEDLMREFQKKRIHIAVVVDEFGGTSGLVTLEDIMEEIIGDIRDEFDEDDHDIKRVNDTTFICDGKVLINDLCRHSAIAIVEFEEARGESDTVAGLVLELAGKFPIVGETVQFKNYTFMVMELEKNRIKKVKLTVEPIVENTENK
jgi:putative hemolysin